MKNAICKFCGSIGTETFPDNTPEEVLLEASTEKCRCQEAEKYRKRQANALEAKAELSELCEADGALLEVKEEIVNIVSRAIDLMPAGDVYKITVSTPDSNIEVKATSAGKITIGRSKAIKRKREIGS